jgi:putative resolvase
VSAHHQKLDLGQQAARLSAWTGQPSLVWVEAEVGSGMNGTKARTRRLLADPAAIVVAMEYRDWLGTMNIELAEAAPSPLAAAWSCWTTTGRRRPGRRHD